MPSPVRNLLFAASAFFAALASANPYPDPRVPPRDRPAPRVDRSVPLNLAQALADALPALRVELAWNPATESFSLADAVIENSGTPALAARSKARDPLGSYVASITPVGGKEPLAWASVGTGAEFRKLSRALNFRFPAPGAAVELRVLAEHPRTGAMEEVLRQVIQPATLRRAAPTARGLAANGFELRSVRKARAKPTLFFNIYAEGYTAARKDRFFEDATRAAEQLVKADWPGVEHFEFRAVFAPSQLALGSPNKLGLPIPERDSFLGLYYPYWLGDGIRWYNIVYPTREARYRRALASLPYDHPLALVDDAHYWGVGNFNELTAIPARSPQFTYLLLHELGHYFGLNEEYEGGGPTELGFAPGIREPWSQNITFNPGREVLKWIALVGKDLPLPTPSSRWRGGGPYGAYLGGYASSEPRGRSHKPGYQCTMEAGRRFCPICAAALRARINHDTGTLRFR